MLSQPPRPSVSQDNNETEGLKLMNCLSCRRRKVRCDRHHPCSQCAKSRLECNFPVSGRSTRRNHDRRVGLRKQSELPRRLRRLEAMIGDLGSQVEHSSNVIQRGLPSLYSEGAVSERASEREGLVDVDVFSGQPATGYSSISYDETPLRSGSDLHGSHNMSRIFEDPDPLIGAVGADEDGLVVVKHGFWTVFCKEVEEIFESIHGPMTDRHFEEHGNSSAMSMSNHQPGSRFHNFLLRQTSTARLEVDSHLLPSQMPYLWQNYVDNVDPFVKILHVPSMTQIFQEMRDSDQPLSPSMHALVMAIAFAAVMSLDDEKIRANFNATRDETLAGCRLASEKSLERVDLVDRPDLPALQALTLYLTVLQSIREAKPAWVLAGSLARSAASLESYKTSTNSCKLNAFETQMQRRLWVQITLLDSRPEGIRNPDCGVLHTRYDTKTPANLNDVELHSGMSDPPADVEGWTDAATFLIRRNIRTLSLQLQDAAATPKGKLEQMKAYKTVIEDSYLQYVDPNQPLHCFVAASTRLFMTKIELLLHAKQRSVETSHTMDESSPSEEIFASALTIIELSYSLQNEPKWSRWRWQLKGQQQPYQAIRFVLTRLCTNPYHLRYKRTISIVQRTLDSLSQSARKDPAHNLVVDLLASAAQRRQTCLTHDADVDKSAMGSDGYDLTSEMALGNLQLSIPSGDVRSGPQKAVPHRSTLQEPGSRIGVVNPSGNAFDETLAMEMDWEELVREMEPCLGNFDAFP